MTYCNDQNLQFPRFVLPSIITKCSYKQRPVFSLDPNQTIKHCSSNIRNCLCTQCLTVWSRRKTLLDNKNSLGNPIENLQNVSCLFQAKISDKLWFYVVAQLSKFFLSSNSSDCLFKQCLTVWHVMKHCWIIRIR